MITLNSNSLINTPIKMKDYQDKKKIQHRMLKSIINIFFSLSYPILLALAEKMEISSGINFISLCVTKNVKIEINIFRE